MKKLCLHNISIHTNFHKNRSINECARMILKGGLIRPWMTFKVILHFIKTLCLHNVDNLEMFLIDWALNKKYIIEKNNFEISR